jgi:D-beta-D-heptose 7-phosphate kinase/D-beta-D-heptose 1-phosphate adenosyltransferase
VIEPRADWQAIVNSLAGRRLLVVGDVMLDEYIAGDAWRVCPEAPVPVVEATGRWCVPGGAANAAANAAALGSGAVLGGVTGDDPAAEELRKTVRAAGVDPAGLIADSTRPTTSKLRVLARGQQVIRVDTELTDPLSQSTARQLADWAARAVGDADAVLLSDYGKGVLANGLCQRVIEVAKRVGCPVVVDPKGSDASRYRGATVIKPNLSELAALTGFRVRSAQDLSNAGHQLAEKLEGTFVLVTRGAEGMVLFKAGTGPIAIAAGQSHRVFDVTGAGDTAAAALATVMAAGHSLETAAKVANVASGVAVRKVGTAIVSPEELLAAFQDASTDIAPLVG